MNLSASRINAASSLAGQPTGNSSLLQGKPAPVYGGAELPVLLRLPHVAPNSPTPSVVSGNDKDAEIAAIESANEPSTAAAEVSDPRPTGREQRRAEQRRQRRVDRGKRPVRTRRLDWLPSTGQVIVAAAIAGGLMIAIVMMGGNSPQQPKSDTANTAVPATQAADRFSAVHSILNASSAAVPDIVTDSIISSPGVPAVSKPVGTTPSANAPELASPANYQQQMQAAPPQPPAAGNAGPEASTDMASNTVFPTANVRPRTNVASPYPTTGVAPLPQQYAPTVAGQTRGWSESLPMGQARRAQTPGRTQR